MGIKLYSRDQLLLDFEEPIHIRDTSSQTEQAGYVDAETQVTRLLRAGASLRDFRLGLNPGLYEYPDGDVPDDVVPDPTQRVGFDFADASAISAQLAAKAQAAKRVAKGETAASVSPSADVSSDQKDLFTSSEA